MTKSKEQIQSPKSRGKLLERRMAGEVPTPYDIKDRTFEFGVMIVEFVGQLPRSRAAWKLGDQLIRSGTSIGANVEEADVAESTPDFIHKMSISRKEARESRYWLRLIKASGICDIPATDYLIDEAYQLVLILSSIINKSRDHQSR